MAQEQSEQDTEPAEDFLALLIPVPRRSPENAGVR
jgi:hypothetical protein